jgi:hypothetical protein
MIKTFSVVWGGRSIPQSSSENNKIDYFISPENRNTIVYRA